MTANERQVGGDHYKVGGEEHWDRVQRLRLNYLQAQITKYVERAPKKNGQQDLEKAKHFLEKYIEDYDKWHPPKPFSSLTPDEQRNVPGWLNEQKARENYEVEGHAANGAELFKCKHCKMEGWGFTASMSPVEHFSYCPLHPSYKPPPEAS